MRFHVSVNFQQFIFLLLRVEGGTGGGAGRRGGVQFNVTVFQYMLFYSALF